MSTTEFQLTPPPGKAPAPGWRLVRGLAPAALLYILLIGWLAHSLYSRTQWWQEADEANLREWLDEARVFRKSLPELVREYLAEREKNALPWELNSENASLGALAVKENEIRDQITALADPTRAYTGQLPLFPEIYRIEVHFADRSLEPIVWDSPTPRPRRQNQTRIQEFDHYLLGESDRRAWLHVEYRLHAFNKIRQDEERRAQLTWGVGALVLFASVGALVWVYYSLKRERAREVAKFQIEQQKEHAEKLALEHELRRQEVERHRDELDRKLLEQSLETERQQVRAAEAERSALELKSQLYASIGIMAGSYAHNIKNLLVRPNDLLSRCLESNGLSRPQEHMLKEVRHTLGTVTERLQQILQTVRRDPSRSEMTRLDLHSIVQDTQQTWEEMARDKWKLNLQVETPNEPLFILGDPSHLQQAVENLLFNARDATFEMRNALREQARSDPKLDVPARQQAVIEAAAWKGLVTLRTRREGDFVVLEVQDNGIGMTEEVRQRCTQTHFSTKRDNALYEGLNSGSGLGLSFVKMVLDHHGATMDVESTPLRGTNFRLRFRSA